MKNLVILLTLLALLLTGCKPRDPSAIPAKPEESASSISSSQKEETPPPSSAEESIPEEESSEEESEPEPEAEPLTFYEEVALNYGGVQEINQYGTRLLKVGDVGFYYLDDWQDANAIESGAYYSWYLSSIFREDIPYEELAEKYKSPRPEDTGRFFPQELYESRIMQYFDVSVEHLRSERLIYDPELGGYYLGIGPGIGQSHLLSVEDVTEEGDTATLRIKIIPQDDVNAPATHKLLTIRRYPDGGYRYLSCVTE